MKKSGGYRAEEGIEALAKELAKCHKRKEELRVEIQSLDRREKEIAYLLNSRMGLVPIEEAAAKVQGMMDKMKALETKQRAESMRKIWANKTPEEREAWKKKLYEARRFRIITVQEEVKIS